MASAGQLLALRAGERERGLAEARVAGAAGRLELTLIDSRRGFDALEDDWNELFDRVGSGTQVFQTFGWNWHWANHFLDGQTSLAVVTGRREGSLVLVWPLVIERRHGLRALAWMGEPVSQYGDVLVERGPGGLTVLRQAWTMIATRLKPDLVRLNKTRADAAVAPLLAEIGAVATQTLEAPYLDLASAPTFADYETRYSQKARKNRRRLQRRLEEQGAVGVREIAAGPQAADAMRHAIELKRGWLKDKGLVSPALADPRTAAFFIAAATAAERDAGVKVSTLLCGAAIAAVEVAVGYCDTIAIHIMAYDTAFEKAGAGVLLMERRIESCLRAGFATYDLMAPGDGYKKEWADGAVRVDDVAIALSGKGKVYAGVWLGWLRPRLKRAVTAGGRWSAGLKRRLTRSRP